MAEEAKPEAPPAETPVVAEETPEFSRAVLLIGHGGLNKVDVQKIPKPKAGEGQVLVKIHASGLNFADLMQRQGLYPNTPPLPYVMGFEASGVIEAIGEGVKDYEVGARVITFSQSLGMMAEYVAVSINNVIPIPDSMSFEDAASLLVNYVTAYQILFDIGHLSKGESVLVHMAGGGVGVAATQLCKTVEDVTVFGTASQPKHEKIKEHGVTHPIDYRNTCYAKEIRKIQPEGVDIVMDPLGGNDTTKGYELLKPFGRIVAYGASTVVKGQSKSLLAAAKLWYSSPSFKSLKLIEDTKVVSGYHLVNAYKKNPKPFRAAMEALVKLHEEGKIKPEIHQVLSLEEIRSAMQLMHDRKNFGKVLLSPLKQPPAPQPKRESKKEKEGKKVEKQEEKAEEKVEEDVADKDASPENKDEGESKGETQEEAKEEEKPAEEKPAEDA